MNKLVVNKVAVLGAGVMGSQIAAHFANCNHEVLLFDLAGRSQSALKQLTKLKPSPIANLTILDRITACDYDTDLNKLSSCDWIIEAVAEDIKIKSDLYTKIQSYVKPTAIITTNTSGISLHNLAEILPQVNNSRFCGVHFFNPPRYQKLVELIPHSQTDPKLIDALEEYTTRFLGKGSVRAKDTPNFIANRIGVFSMLITMYYADKYHLSFDTVDFLTGELIGRPKSGTFRTADVVGLDTLASVIHTLYTNCLNDPWHEFLQAPNVLLDLINNKCLGQKTQKGFYFKDKNSIKVWNPSVKQYVESDAAGKNLDSKLLEILKTKSVPDRFKQLRDYNHPQAQFLWSCFKEVWHYSAYHLSNIADNVRDVDHALKWGFGWQNGPFELWQAIGWAEVNAWLNIDINNNISLAKIELPKWVLSIHAPYDGDTAYSPSSNSYKTVSGLAVYKRQNKPKQNIILENNSAKLWLTGKNLVFSLKTKMNVINTESLELLNQVIEYINISSEYASLVIWQDKGEHFSAGADLKGFMASYSVGDYIGMESALTLFQDICQKLRYSNFPVVAAVKGLALGGGCELMLHCDKVVAALESYIGLVEVGVGVLPSGGGCKEMILRAKQYYDHLLGQKLVTSPDKLLEQYFMNIATAQSSSSAYDAIDKGYLRKTDSIIANSDELLYVACELATAMAEANYRAPIKSNLRVSGTRIKANFLAKLANFKQGNFISDHDYLIASKICNILSGGNVDPDSLVTEDWLLKLEREEFIALLKTPKTQERINYMLTKGKPLRN